MAAENVYRLWHQALQHAKPEDWDKAFKKKCGSATELPFDEWWEETKEYFEVLPPFLCRVITSKEEAEQWSLWDSELAPGEKVLLVSLEYPKATLMAEIDKQITALLLARQATGTSQKQSRTKLKAGRPTFESLAEIPLTNKPNVAEIQKLLSIYALREPTAKMTHVMIAKKFKLAAYKEPGTDRNGKVKPMDRATVQTLISASTKHTVMAKRLIENAAKGRFPDYQPPKPPGAKATAR